MHSLHPQPRFPLSDGPAAGRRPWRRPWRWARRVVLAGCLGAALLAVARPVPADFLMDMDGDGFTAETDCDDHDAGVYPGAPEFCDDGLDQDCSGGDLPCADCPDEDRDGYASADCGGRDCDDRDAGVYPGAAETCGDGRDQDCDGRDTPCRETAAGPDGEGMGLASNPAHTALAWDGSPGVCLPCHEAEAREVHASVHYQWQGPAPSMSHGPPRQGKLAGAQDSYAGPILGNWDACGACHIGLGRMPEDDGAPSLAQLAEIDCLVCHQAGYRRLRRKGRYVPDTQAMGMSLDDAVRRVHRPQRANCLACHAMAHGGDGVKRGDLAQAQARTFDREFDVHMALEAGNLRCQDCHGVERHRFAGQGTDLRPTDRPHAISCAACHRLRDTAEGHAIPAINRHVARVACQTCHVPLYAREAFDTPESEATEIHRSWRDTADLDPPFRPAGTQANNLVPRYRFWNRLSTNGLLRDSVSMDPATGAYPSSRPQGAVGDPPGASKLYPFKYHTTELPRLPRSGELVAPDTRVFAATGDGEAAAAAGVVNMGHPPGEPYRWVSTDAFQLLNHQVAPAYRVLGCGDCHGNPARMNLQGELGYQLKGSTETACTRCHQAKKRPGFRSLHEGHVSAQRLDCSHCHHFSRPERGLRRPAAS